MSKPKSGVERFLDPKPTIEKFHGAAPKEVLEGLDKIQRDLGVSSRNKIMIAAFRLLIETHNKKVTP